MHIYAPSNGWFPPNKKLLVYTPQNQQLAPENKPSHEKIIFQPLIFQGQVSFCWNISELQAQVSIGPSGPKNYAPKPNITSDEIWFKKTSKVDP